MIKTDISDLGHYYFSIERKNMPYMNRDIDNKFSKSVFLGICNFFIRFFYYLVKSPFCYNRQLRRDNAILIYGESTNNRNTLLPIINELGEEKVIDLYSQKQYPKWKQYWYAFPHLYELTREMRNSDPERKSRIKYFFAKFWVMYGCNKAAGELLDYYRPKILVMANDHLHFQRSLMREANKRGITTIYVQHAAVSDRFPPLGFSYSLLDGEDSYNKYKKNENTSGRIYLCGGIRFDAIKQSKNKNLSHPIVGIAINQVDEEEVIKNTCLTLNKTKAKESLIEVILRPHPQMQLSVWKDWCDHNGVSFSNPKEETSFDFLSRISALVSNESSIHLDAAMCHTPTVIYNMSNGVFQDVYLFVKNNLAPYAEDISALMTFILNCGDFSYNEEAVKYYNCSYGTNYEGHVAKFMADLIDSIPDSVEKFNKKYHFTLIEEDNNKRVYKSES
jgi:hypothetical protein